MFIICVQQQLLKGTLKIIPGKKYYPTCTAIETVYVYVISILKHRREKLEYEGKIANQLRTNSSKSCQSVYVVSYTVV